MENLNTNYNFIEDFIPIEYNKTPKQNIHTFWSHNSTTITKTYDIYKCSNCGAQGHQYRNCIKPIFSYGILYYKTEPEFSILMVQRKQTISFVDFVRGKYNLKNINNINRMFSTMTKEEKEMIENNTFDELWRYVWGNKNQNVNSEYRYAHKRYEILSKNYIYNNIKYDLPTFIKINPEMISLEWCIPKGRRNKNESDFNCAKREFFEETNIQIKNSDTIQSNIFTEEFVSDNNVCYKYIYYPCKAEESIENKNPKISETNIIQKTEIGNIKWMTINEAEKCLVPENYKRFSLLKKIEKMLN